VNNEVFHSKSDDFVFVGSGEGISRLKLRDEILEAFKKEKGIQRPEELPIEEFLEFRKELFERYKQAGI